MAEILVHRRLAAIAVADVVGYSRMMEADKAGTLALLKDRRTAILEPVVRAHGGRVVKLMGDGVLLEFASAVNAVKAALELQGKFAEANGAIPGDRHVILRIGINIGDVIGEGSDIYGDGVNIAARLESLADPGGVCISNKVHEEVRGRMKADFEDAGEQQLKNISTPVRVFKYRVGPRPDAPRPLALPDKPSIAVLPFQNMSGDPEQDYFADGMVEEIITALSRMRWLFVIARNSSFAYKGKAVDIKQIGRELGVRYILEGSVRKGGNRVRITGQLIDTSTGSHLWADRFDGELADVFELQDQVTARVVGAIGSTLEQAEIERSRRKPTENLDAYDYYLRGIAALHPWTREANDEALAMFGRAIDLDPLFASAYGMAARCYVQRKAAGWVGDRAREIAETSRLARSAAELGKTDAVALCTAGMGLIFVVGDMDHGAALIDQALVLNPNLAWAWMFSGWAKVWRGEPEAAIVNIAYAMRLSPQDSQMFAMQGGIAMAHFFAGRHDEAMAWAEAAIRQQSSFRVAIFVAAASAALAGRTAEAEKAVARLREIDPAMRISDATGLLPIRRPENLAMLTEGLRQAGLPEA